MSNFNRQIKKLGQLERLENELDGLRMFEARATMVLAVYEALAGGIENELMQHVQNEVAKLKVGTKAEFFQAVVGIAKAWLVERQFEEATRELDAKVAAEAEAFIPLDTLVAQGELTPEQVAQIADARKQGTSKSDAED